MTLAEASAARAAAVRCAVRSARAAASAVPACSARAALSSDMRVSSTINDRSAGGSIIASRPYACTSVSLPCGRRGPPARDGPPVRVTRPHHPRDESESNSNNTPRARLAGQMGRQPLHRTRCTPRMRAPGEARGRPVAADALHFATGVSCGPHATRHSGWVRGSAPQPQRSGARPVKGRRNYHNRCTSTSGHRLPCLSPSSPIGRRGAGALRPAVPAERTSATRADDRGQALAPYRRTARGISA